jgi:hypothetical protein
MIAEERTVPAAVPNAPARGRIALAGLVVFLLVQVSEVALHGFVLAATTGRSTDDSFGTPAEGTLPGHFSSCRWFTCVRRLVWCGSA